MGSPEDDKDAQDNEKPQHRVRITRPFYLGVHEVTRGQFRRFVDEAGYQTEAEKDGKGGYGWNEDAKKFEQNPSYTWRKPGFEQTDEHPVVNVSWNDAVAFAEWLSRKEGKTYRLAHGGRVGICLPGRHDDTVLQRGRCGGPGRGRERGGRDGEGEVSRLDEGDRRSGRLRLYFPGGPLSPQCLGPV